MSWKEKRVKTEHCFESKICERETLFFFWGVLITVCLDGTLPGYHLHSGHGSGANSWLIQLEVSKE